MSCSSSQLNFHFAVLAGVCAFCDMRAVCALSTTVRSLSDRSSFSETRGLFLSFTRFCRFFCGWLCAGTLSAVEICISVAVCEEGAMTCPAPSSSLFALNVAISAYHFARLHVETHTVLFLALCCTGVRVTTEGTVSASLSPCLSSSELPRTGVLSKLVERFEVTGSR